jgi:hypothetical protein
MNTGAQRQTAELLTSIALLSVVRQLQIAIGVPMTEASALVTSVLPACTKLIEVWRRRPTAGGPVSGGSGPA